MELEIPVLQEKQPLCCLIRYIAIACLYCRCNGEFNSSLFAGNILLHQEETTENSMQVQLLQEKSGNEDRREMEREGMRGRAWSE